MVQKFFRIFTVLNLLFLFSCSPEKNEAVLSVDRIDRIDTFVYTDSGDLLDLIGQKKDFVLTIAQVGCETCKRIQAPMKAYIQTTSLPIYWIEIQEYRKTVELLSEDEEYRLRSIVASASLLLFDDGKDIRYIEYDPKIYASEKAFSDQVGKYYTASPYRIGNDLEEYDYYGEETMVRFHSLGYSEIESLIQSPSEVSILFSWYDCPDCQEFKSRFLDGYLTESGKELTFFEVSAVRNSEIWTEFKSRFQFDSYREGRVPSIVTYRNGEKVDMAVFVNDVIAEENGVYRVIESFWGEEIVGISADTAEECRKKASDKECLLIEAYLDRYL